MGILGYERWENGGFETEKGVVVCFVEFYRQSF